MFGETERSVEGERQLTVELPLYGDEGLLRACYAFTDRCFLFLRDRPVPQVTVVFRKRQSPRTLDALVEEFANELVGQSLRAQLAAETKCVRELIVSAGFRRIRPVTPLPRTFSAESYPRTAIEAQLLAFQGSARSESRTPRRYPRDVRVYRMVRQTMSSASSATSP